ncbi:DUF3990 domain-containing protein [Moraxella nasovis]|uniref:DUF3990 domain-containing protein n=1 Tax=Moraxella nasovis TaxID=2904121 RepID=UPI001F61D718|nr:DUF3990 domain-containing protein [Moraxella nasovis]UNU72559.1 DUF3990 domain-containing protein [Moraxella nasovis]
MITLYHGSNVEVATPKILSNLRAMDFGSGFYLTSNFHQAERWARLVCKRRGQGQAIVNIYEFDEVAPLNIKRFLSADGEWLEFVVTNRKALGMFDYDVVVGAVADDATLPVIDDYMDGRYTIDEAVKRLLPQNLTDQYAFCTQTALDYLTFIKSQII